MVSAAKLKFTRSRRFTRNMSPMRGISLPMILRIVRCSISVAVTSFFLGSVNRTQVAVQTAASLFVVDRCDRCAFLHGIVLRVRVVTLDCVLHQRQIEAALTNERGDVEQILV